MLCERRKRTIAIVLTIAIQCYSYASTTSAVLHTKGTVQVNGTVVPGSVAVLGGEDVLVSANSSASFRMQRTSILATPYTSLKWISPVELTLRDGDIFVDTLDDVKTNLGTCGYVIPTNKQADLNHDYTKYEIQIQGNRAIVYARELPVTVDVKDRRIDLDPLHIAVVENINALRCTVAYYPNVEDILAKSLIVGSVTTAAIVSLTLPTSKQPISTVGP